MTTPPRTLTLGALVLAAAALAAPAAAQQRIGYVDSAYLLSRVPEYQTAQQQLDRQAQLWRTEIDGVSEQVEGLERDFATRELLFTEAERDRLRREISDRRREGEALRLRYFGTEGELFREQNRLMRPIQERILGAIEEVARVGNFDYVFDKSGDYVFLFARPQLDLSDRVLEELGIDVGMGR
jgi:outer membrane protein